MQESSEQKGRQRDDQNKAEQSPNGRGLHRLHHSGDPERDAFCDHDGKCDEINDADTATCAVAHSIHLSKEQSEDSSWQEFSSD